MYLVLLFKFRRHLCKGSIHDRLEGREGRLEGREQKHNLSYLAHSLGISSKKRQRIRVDGEALAKQSNITSLLVVFRLEFTLVITGTAGKKNNTNRSHQQ